MLISAAQADALLSWHFAPPPPDNERSHPLFSSSSIKPCNKQFPAGEKRGRKKKEIHIGGKGIQAISCHLSLDLLYLQGCKCNVQQGLSSPSPSGGEGEKGSGGEEFFKYPHDLLPSFSLFPREGKCVCETDFASNFRISGRKENVSKLQYRAAFVSQKEILYCSCAAYMKQTL